MSHESVTGGGNTNSTSSSHLGPECTAAGADEQSPTDHCRPASGMTSWQKSYTHTRQVSATEGLALVQEVFDESDILKLHSFYQCTSQCSQLSSEEQERHKSLKYKFNHHWIADNFTFCNETGYHWLVYSEQEHGMLCLLCRKHDTTNARNKSRVYNSVAAVRFRKTAVEEHATSQQHRAAINAELTQRVSFFEKEVQQKRQVADEILYKAFMSCYFLAKSEISNTKILSLLNLIEHLGVDNLKYFSHRSRASTREIFVTIGQTIKDTILGNVRSAGKYALLTDDVTDLALIEQMVTFISYVHPQTALPQVDFLFLADVLECSECPDAATLTDVLLHNLGGCGLHVSDLTSMVSDGAKVFLGRLNGVGARMKRLNPAIVIIHCICHRLALACGDSNNETAYITSVETNLTQLWNFFAQSPKRSAILAKCQVEYSKLNLSGKAERQVMRRVQKACRTRWLSMDKCVQGLVKDFVPIMQALRILSTKYHEAAATGLLSRMNTSKFVGALYVLKSVLPILTALSLTFQYGTINFPRIAPAIKCAKARLQALVKDDDEEESQISRELRQDLQEGGKLSTLELQLSRDSEAVDKLLSRYVSALQDNIDARFEDSLPVLPAFAIFDIRSLPQKDSVHFKHYGEGDIQKLSAHFYPGEEAAGTQLGAEWATFKYELVSWKEHLPDSENLSTKHDTLTGPSTPTEWVLHNIMTKKAEYRCHYPRLTSIAEVLYGMPVSNAWPERGASAVKRVKTRLRSAMKNDLLNALLHITINGPSIGTPEASSLIDKAVETWKVTKPRRKLPRVDPLVKQVNMEESLNRNLVETASTATQVDMGDSETEQAELDAALKALDLEDVSVSDDEDDTD